MVTDSSDATSIEITPKTSKRICKDMNEDHYWSVYNMALSTLPKKEQAEVKLDQCKMTKATLSEIHLSFVICEDSKGGKCQLRTGILPLVPVLKTGKDIKDRIIEIHHDLLVADLTCLFTEPLMFMILITMAALIYVKVVFGLENFDSYLTNDAPDFVSSIIIQVFGSTATFVSLANVGLYFGLLAHYVEAVYVSFQCERKLKMKFRAIASWFFMTLMVGYPSTKKVLKLLALKEKSSAIAEKYKAAKKSS